jgi:RIO kinase 1
MLQPGARLSGHFEARTGPVDLAAVLREVNDAEAEEAARLRRIAVAG